MDNILKAKPAFQMATKTNTDVFGKYLALGAVALTPIRILSVANFAMFSAFTLAGMPDVPQGMITFSGGSYLFFTAAKSSLATSANIFLEQNETGIPLPLKQKLSRTFKDCVRAVPFRKVRLLPIACKMAELHQRLRA